MSKISIYQQAAQRGGAWLASRLDPSGLLPTEHGLHACHKGVWAFAAIGQVDAAHHLLNAIRDQLMCRPGEFYPEGQGQDDSWRSYYGAVVLVGACRLGRFDIASPQAADQLCNYQHSSGGFFGRIAPPETLLDICITAQCGWACMALGRHEAARRAADFIANAYERQPEPDRRLFVKVGTQTSQLVTNPPTNARIEYMVDATHSRQRFFYAGICAGFLADQFALTRDDRYLQAARGLLDFDFHTPPDSLHWPSKCKVGWGAALLYRVTREEKYKALAERVADVTFCGAQLEHGGWPGMQLPVDDASTTVEVSPDEITAEFIYELMEIAGALV